MTRPSNADSAGTYEQILAAARELAEEEGPSAVTFRSVAQRSGVGRGTISYYFQSKEGLLEACLDPYYERLEELTKTVSQLLSSAADPREAVEGATILVYRFARREETALRLRASSNAERGHLHPRRIETVLRPTLDRAAEIFLRLGGAGSDSVRLTFQSITFLVMKYVLYSEAEIAAVLGRTVSPTEFDALVERHLADVAATLLVPGPAA